MSPPATRRQILRGIAAATLCGSARAEGFEPARPIIDTHVHFWDLNRFRLRWLDGDGSLNRSFLPGDYARAAEGLNVIKAIYMEVDVVPSQQVLEARHVSELCGKRDTPFVAAVVSGRPGSDEFAAYIKPLSADPAIKGVRQVLHATETPAGFCLDRAFVKGIQLLGGLGLSFDLCMRAAELDDGLRLIELCPGTQFILDHCGNPDVFGKDLSPWKRAIAGMARRPNVACKVSGIVASTRGRDWKADDLAPVIDHVLAVFGPDRVMFGGDWPVCTLGSPLSRWVQALRQVVANRDALQQSKLFHDNADRLYRLGA